MQASLVWSVRSLVAVDLIAWTSSSCLASEFDVKSRRAQRFVQGTPQHHLKMHRYRFYSQGNGRNTRELEVKFLLVWRICDATLASALVARLRHPGREPGTAARAAGTRCAVPAERKSGNGVVRQFKLGTLDPPVKCSTLLSPGP